MITVRFSTGFSVQYNDLHFSSCNAGISRLYRTAKERDAERGARIVVSGDFLIEHDPPCKTYFTKSEDIESETRFLLSQIDKLRQQVTKLKAERKSKK